ncbi:MAG: ATP-binding protein [Paracoccaceae bacterium]
MGETVNAEPFSGNKGGALDDLIQLEARNSPGGLFLRYARGRVRTFLARQVMTGFGSVALLALGQVEVALACVAAALVGEAVDCLTLLRILRRHRPETVDSDAILLAVLSGCFQSATIAACVWITWVGVGTTGSAVFALTFLFSAVINAGIVRPFFPQGANARLIIFAATASVLLMRSFAAPAESGFTLSELFFITTAVLVLAVAASSFIAFVARSNAQRYRFERELLLEKRQLELSRRALVEKEKQARQLALVAQHANDSVIITNEHARIEWVNKTFTQLTGYTFDEAVGRDPGDLLNGPETSDRSLRDIRAARLAKRPVRVEIQNRTKSGKPIWIETNLTPIFDDLGQHTVTIAVERDITEAKLRETELARAQAEAEAAAQAKSQFLATMSHEIRTPMNGVIGMAQLLSDTPLDDQQRKYTDTIVESGQALLAIINDILDLSKLQAGKPLVTAAPFDLERCVRGAVDLLRPTAQAKTIGLTLTLSPLPPALLGDAGRIRQILINLIGNAIKFTTDGQVAVSVTAEREGDHHDIAIAIADTGIGIPESRLATIFESFTQADGNISRQFGGTGLGLTISRLLSREMGGDISVRSTEGEGSVFTLSLSLPDAPAACPPRPPRTCPTA